MPRLTAQDYVVLPAGEYRAVIKDIQPGPDTFGPTLKFWFEIADDPDFAGETVTALASSTFMPRSKLRKWAETLTGRTFKAGEVFDTDTLLNLPCRLTLEERVTPDGVFNRVLALLPPARSRVSRQPTPSQPQPSQDLFPDDQDLSSDTVPDEVPF